MTALPSKKNARPGSKNIFLGWSQYHHGHNIDTTFNVSTVSSMLAVNIELQANMQRK
jgi:hypothetical protein